ncbi:MULTISPECIES: gamma-glutamyl-gamma-aminobutyrate hydrolase family protein [unclassified Facklamia]|uniref:gamma-glutamyl-gamma-aminobutyrate hydrolase family protein n=1 Tax=Aerococcaceae TaxID=186827 RepID=UPI0013B9EC85|nr:MULTISPECIES: gamma-glutamyl-gamma-aminobutyrate hydrolase family protein [unclassified Facklamia]NEW64227.1 gamma-glutamyl-gamma-aminobutyrate hydrolase family protein [Facklamia sp. 252]NEW68314.1 gamma-glutamyl-gamma-aminobutyrate hydrolase family protein [Facklamia sp. 253]QQD65930.1 gamma-glutamyl-gamma-aminobutyrate hydrolase family protein [Aerococcaceae bacterium zg-252]
MKPVIGITGNISQLSGNQGAPLTVNYSPLGFSQAIELAGGSPIILPIMNEDNAEAIISIVDGLLLTGGEDVSPHFYNEEPRMVIGATSPERDRSEILLMKEAMRQNKPILGICRGMQLINVVLGGTLYQDLSENEQITIQHVQKTKPHHPTHSIVVKENSHIASIFKTGDYVNSFHHQVLKDIAPGLSITAWSPDNVPEAVELFENHQSILGLQWHPELNAIMNNQQSLAIFKDLVQRANKARHHINQQNELGYHLI